jgi:hypothetical protein
MFGCCNSKKERGEGAGVCVESGVSEAKKLILRIEEERGACLTCVDGLQ